MSQLITNKLGNQSVILVVKYPNRIIKHCGILTVYKNNPIVFHNDDIKTNPYGGNIVHEPLATFLSGRMVKNATLFPLTFEEIQAYSKANREKKYNQYFYNCEQYISEIAIGKKRSPQLRKFLTMGASVMLLPFIL